MTIDDLRAAQAEVAKVDVGDSVYDTLVDIRSDMQMEGLIASDRRYRQTIKAMQATAWLHERDVVTDDDFRILESERTLHVLNAPSPAATASLAIGRHISKLAKRFL